MKIFTVHCLQLTTSLFFCCSFAVSEFAKAQKFTRSTIPLKFSGSMTSIQSQGQSVNYLNRGVQARRADAKNVSGFTSNAARREIGFVQSPDSSANSYYRQA